MDWKVLAIVVTYNRCALLKEQKYKGQTRETFDKEN